MAHIKLTAVSSYCGGPEVHILHARLGKRDQIGGGTTPVLLLSVGTDLLEMWPADPNHLEQLGRKLLKLAARIRAGD